MTSRLKAQHIYLATSILWVLALLIHGSLHIYSTLSGPPDSDLYANSLGFQVIAYLFVWLPRFLGVLVVVLLLEFAIFGRKMHSGGSEHND